MQCCLAGDSEHPEQSMSEQERMTPDRFYSFLCTEQDTSQALQALASMPKDTLLQKLRAQGELSQRPCCSL